MLLQNTVHPQEQLPTEEITSPLAAQLFEFCKSELFPETLQNSEVASSSNCGYEEHSSYPTRLSIAADMNTYNSRVDNDNKPVMAGTGTSAAPSAGPSTPTPTTARHNNLSLIFDPAEDQLDNDIAASIDFTSSPSFSVPHQQYINQNNNDNQEPFGISSLNSHLSLGDMVEGTMHTAHQYMSEERHPTIVQPPPIVPILGPPLPTSYEEECSGLPSMQPYLRLRNSSPACALMDPMIAPYLSSASMSAPFSAEGSGIFTGSGLMLGTDLSHQEMDYQGDNGGFFLPELTPRVFNCSSELQALSGESQHLVHGGASNTPLASEITSLDDPTFKVGKLSIEERKRKIHRYMKKRNERNFSKKIKYACRKTLADSRPRVRGRFAKNDELGELGRPSGSNQEDDTDEDTSLYSNPMADHQRKMVKEEEDLDSSEIFAHINSFKCNYPIQSWI